MDNDNDFVTHAECYQTSQSIIKELSKQGLALYGQDGRGGIQHDMTITKEIVERIEDVLNGKDIIEVNNKLTGVDWAKILAAVITTSGLVLIGFLQFVLPLMMKGGG